MFNSYTVPLRVSCVEKLTVISRIPFGVVHGRFQVCRHVRQPGIFPCNDKNKNIF